MLSSSTRITTRIGYVNKITLPPELDVISAQKERYCHHTLFIMFCDQGERVGSWQEHVIGFKTLISFKCHCWNQTLVASTYYRSKKHVEYIKALYCRISQVSGFKFFLTYIRSIKTNLKLVTCRSDFRLILLDHSTFRCNLMFQTVTSILGHNMHIQLGDLYCYVVLPENSEWWVIWETSISHKYI